MRLARLVDNLLLLARGEAGELVERRPLRLDVLVAQVTAEAQEAGTGHVLVLEELPMAEVLGDGERLRQVLRNVVGNALGHTPPGTTISIGLVRRGDEVEVVVRDTGPGIAAEHLPHVFHRFYRVGDGARSRTGRAAARGTARDGRTARAWGSQIVKHLVEAHGGTVKLESAPGRETRVSIRLPA